jgi:hypothetical protein
MSALSHISKLKLAPGMVDSINAEGQNFWIVYAAVPIQIMIPGGEFGTYEQGTGLDSLPNGETFKRLTVRNPSLANITVVIYVGGPLYRDSRMALMEGRTRLAAWNGTSLAGGASQTFDGLNPADGGFAGYIDLKRHSLVIANLDPANALQILDGAGTVCSIVFAQTEMILPVSEKITVKNGTGSAIACYIAEVWSAAPF